MSAEATPVSGPPTDSTPDFMGELGFEPVVLPNCVRGRSGPPLPALMLPRTDVIRPSVLFAIADMLVGMSCGQWAAGRALLTVDLNLRMIKSLDPARGFSCVGQMLKMGRTTAVGEAWFTSDGDEEPAAVSRATFGVSPRAQDTDEIADRLEMKPPLQVPFAQRLGVRRIAPGVAEVARDPALVNNADTIHGAAVALVAEEAACSLSLESVPVSLDVSYLAAVRVGPARASAVRYGDLVHVETRDVGADRQTSVAVVRLGRVWLNRATHGPGGSQDRSRGVVR